MPPPLPLVWATFPQSARAPSAFSPPPHDAPFSTRPEAGRRTPPPQAFPERTVVVGGLSFGLLGALGPASPLLADWITSGFVPQRWTPRPPGSGCFQETLRPLVWAGHRPSHRRTRRLLGPAAVPPCPVHPTPRGPSTRVTLQRPVSAGRRGGGGVGCVGCGG